MPRPTLSQEKIEEVFTALEMGYDAEYLDLFYGKPTSVISDCLRGFLVAPKGKDLIAADWSAVEARVLSWLAGQQSTLDAFSRGEDIYKVEAGNIYGIPAAKADKAQRQIGKVAILALGYQGGVDAFQSMARNYNVVITPDVAADLWARSPERRRQKCEWGWESRGRKSGIWKPTWYGAELIKLAWREANPRIVEYWGHVESAATNAVKEPGVIQVVGVSAKRDIPYVQFLKKGSFLFCRLPSGRCLSYPYPEISEAKTPWDELKPMLKYKTEINRKWVRQTAYGGMLVENITQAVARDLLAEALVRVEAAGFAVVLHVHDEIVCEVDHWEGSGVDFARRRFESLVAAVPIWAKGLPIAVEGWRRGRFGK